MSINIATKTLSNILLLIIISSLSGARVVAGDDELPVQVQRFLSQQHQSYPLRDSVRVITKFEPGLDSNTLQESIALSIIDTSMEHPIGQFPMEIQLCTNLRTLHIRSFHWKTIPDWVFLLPKLEELSIANCIDLDLSKFLEQVSRSPKIKSLVISLMGTIDTVDVSGSLEHLIQLDIGSNKYLDLPPFLYKCTGLQSLSLSVSPLLKISLIPSFFQTLKTLDLDHCESRLVLQIINGMPPGNSLQELDITSCDLKELPDGIKHLTQLRSLSMGRNQIEFIPAFIGELQHLLAFQISENKLKNVPEELYTLDQLYFINLIGNPIPKSELEYFRAAIKGNVLY